jgi:uncharacterized protein (UPF0333 family)
LEGKVNLDKTQVKVFFSLYGDEFPIDYVTESLGIEPTNFYKKGDIVLRPHKHNVISTKTQFRKETAWELSTDYQESYDVKEQMDQILKPLKSKVAIINHLKTKYKLECDISIVIIMENGGTPGLHLDIKLIEFANSIKAEIDIDLYSNPYDDTFEE